MLLILIIWCYLGFTFFNCGFALRQLLRIRNEGTSLIMIFGLFSVTLMASTWAIFGRIHYEFQLFLLVFHLMIVVRYRRDLVRQYQTIYEEFKKLEFQLKLLLLVGFTLILFHASSSSFLIDNETYYIQTIKWLSSYGFVPGLGNLHIFFGQTSGWHILQSAFSFPYFISSSNDLNGFCLCLGLAFSTHRLQQYFIEHNATQLWSGLLFVPLLLFTPLTGAPSPDFAVMLFSLFLFYYFISYEQKPSSNSWVVLCILALFLVYIKISALPVLLIPLFYLLFHFKAVRSGLWPGLTISSAALMLFVIKNTILTGYPLYPSPFLSHLIPADFKLPEALYDFWWSPAKNYDFVVSQKEFYRFSSLEILHRWLTGSITNYLIGGLLFVVILVAPWAIKKTSYPGPYRLIYVVMLVHILYLILTTPQYRFILSFVLFFLTIVASTLLNQRKVILGLQYFSLLIGGFLILFPFPAGQHKNILNWKTNHFSVSQLICPKPISSLNTHFTTKSKGNLRYVSPGPEAYIWATGDGMLPCVNSRQITYFEQELGFIPQRRGKTLAQGFYFKKVKKP